MGAGMGAMGAMGAMGSGMGMPPAPAVAPAAVSIRAFDKAGFQVVMEASKPEGNAAVTRVLCRFNNLNAAPIEGLVFQVRALFFRLFFYHHNFPSSSAPPKHRSTLHSCSSSATVPTQAAVPKYLKLELQPPSSTTIPPSSSGQVTQVRPSALQNSPTRQPPLLSYTRTLTRAHAPAGDPPRQQPAGREEHHAQAQDRLLAAGPGGGGGDAGLVLPAALLAGRGGNGVFFVWGDVM